MKVLVACEESQAVCKAFRELGHEAYSCDIQDCSGGHPEWHIFGDVLKVLNPHPIQVAKDDIRMGIEFYTNYGQNVHTIFGKWDLIIAHPPCTYLSHAATQCHSLKCFSLEYINRRTMERIEGMLFFMRFAMADCEKIAIENPTGVMNTCYRKPDQTIHPWYFASSEQDELNYHTKKTHLWLKGLTPLSYDISHLPEKVNGERWANGKRKNWTEANHGGRARSKTFPGIAKAMAEQWGGKL